ncbi:MAG: hypothetical protein NTY22_08330, partial [Proteobacteria bacterium]|nr:hypothetical protein [Pseudomonadota bacterium]
ELADVYLSSIGVDIKTLSDIFLNSSNGTVTIDSLAEGIITAGSITMENAVDSKKHAKEAVKAFDDYGALLIGQGVTNANQIATFYGVLSRMCQIAVLMAYADIGPNGDGDGRITKTDICSTIACGISGTICIDSLVSCGGMDNADALEAANALYSIKNELATLGLGNLQKAVDSMASKIIPLPPTFLTSGSILSFFTDPALETYRADAGRELLREIAR